MRVQCTSCQAKYTIADEKVGKKVVELRCKQCKEMIVIDGSLPPPPDGSASAISEAPPSVTAARREGGRGRGTDLFGNAGKAGSEEEEIAKATPSPSPPPARPAPAPKVEAAHGPKLTGARAEDSVLFALSALTSEKSGEGGAGAGAVAAEAAPASQTSGLIDIRSLGVDLDGADSRSAKKESSVDDIMNLSGGGAFGTALAAPALGVVGSETTSSSIAPGTESKTNKSLAPAILMGSALIAVAIVVAVVLGRAPAPQPVGTSPTATMTGLGTSPTSSVVAATSTSMTGGASVAAPTTGEASAKVAGIGPSDKGARTVAPATGAGAAASVTAASATPEETAPPASASASAMPTTPAPAPAPDKPADLASALANAAGKTDEKPAETAPQGSGAPFDRGAASAALGSIDIQGCKKPDGPTGAGHVTITFAPDGSVASAIVDQGPFPSTPVGGCIAGKFRGAHVPAFSGAPVRVGKSFTLN